MKILLIEDNELIVQSLKSELKNHELIVHDSLADLDIRSLPLNIDLVLLDLMSSKDPDAKKTLSRIPELRFKTPHGEIWVQSGNEDISLMRQCIEVGAYRFILKDQLLMELPLILGWSEERRQRRDQLEKSIIGKSFLCENLRAELLSLARTDVDVLIQGESGTGKELCAQAFAVKGKPLVAVNVSAIPKELFEGELFGYEKGAFSGAVGAKEGFFEAAHGGVLFFDEIQSLSLELQSKILRVLETRKFRRLGSIQEKSFECRIVCASNRDLREASKKGEFREDLFYRIAPVTVSVPPLRLRSEDIPLIAHALLHKLDPQQKIRIDEDGLRALSEYDWPGNVRELQGSIKALLAKSRIPIWSRKEIESVINSEATLNIVPTNSAPQSSVSSQVFQVNWDLGLDQNVQNLERWMMEHVLRESNGLEARERLQLKRSRFYEKLKQYSLLKDEPIET